MRKDYVRNALTEICITLDEAQYDEATAQFEQLVVDLQTDAELADDED